MHFPPYRSRDASQGDSDAMQCRRVCLNKPCSEPNSREEPDTFKLVRHVMRAILSVGPSALIDASLPFKPVLILKYATRVSTEQISMRTKWFRHIVIYQEHLLKLNEHDLAY